MGRWLGWGALGRLQDSALDHLAIMKMLTTANISRPLTHISSSDPHTTLRSGYPSTPTINIRKLRLREVANIPEFAQLGMGKLGSLG